VGSGPGSRACCGPARLAHGGGGLRARSRRRCPSPPRARVRFRRARYPGAARRAHRNADGYRRWEIGNPNFCQEQELASSSPDKPARPRLVIVWFGGWAGAPSAIRQRRTRLVLQPAVASRQQRRRRMRAPWSLVWSVECGLIHVLFCARTTLVFSTTRGRFTRLCLELKSKNNIIEWLQHHRHLG
jgi:hypothetical protein